jgi:hypothetical protein
LTDSTVSSAVEGRLIGILSFDVADSRIQNLFIIADPQKFGGLEASKQSDRLVDPPRVRRLQKSRRPRKLAERRMNVS